ncbi:MAG: RHS repeat-associated core domain-containing protein, partial [Blastocatellia bacterium]
GSTRVITASTTPTSVVLERDDFLPFGEEIGNIGAGRNGVAGYSSSTDIRQKFTSKERDAESYLDYFGARYCSSSEGRFLSVDPYNPVTRSRSDDDLKTYLNQPQAWNKYPYTINNPLKYYDPSGERWFVKDGEYPVWVNPNKDGSYSSPGKDWTAWVPKDSYDVLRYTSDHGTLAYRFFENKDGSPGFEVLATGKADDASDEVIEVALAANGFYRAFQLAQAVWNGFLASTDHSIESVEDIFKDPSVLRQKTPEDVAPKIRDTAGWKEETMRHSQSNPGGGWLFREYSQNGQPSGRMIQFHPGGGHHGPLPYWKVSSATGGTVRIPVFGK